MGQCANFFLLLEKSNADREEGVAKYRRCRPVQVDMTPRVVNMPYARKFGKKIICKECGSVIGHKQMSPKTKVLVFTDDLWSSIRNSKSIASTSCTCPERLDECRAREECQMNEEGSEERCRPIEVEVLIRRI